MLSTHLLFRHSSYRNIFSVPELVLKIPELKGNQQEKDEGRSPPQISITILDSNYRRYSLYYPLPSSSRTSNTLAVQTNSPHLLHFSTA